MNEIDWDAPVVKPIEGKWAMIRLGDIWGPLEKIEGGYKAAVGYAHCFWASSGRHKNPSLDIIAILDSPEP